MASTYSACSINIALLCYSADFLEIKKEMGKKKKNMFILDDKKKEKTGQTNQKVTSAKGSPELEGQKRPV